MANGIDPKNQRPELWNLFNSRLNAGESIRVFPLSNWTELDVWQYIHLENIPIVPLYFAKEREMVVRRSTLIPVEMDVPFLPGERKETHIARCIDARLIWMHSQPLDLRKQYLVKHTTQTVKARVRFIRYVVDVNTMERSAATELKLNEIGAVVIDAQAPLFVDPYQRNRSTGSFVLIDPISNLTMAAGMVTGRDPERGGDRIAGTPESNALGLSRVSPEKRRARIGHPPALIWLNEGAEFAYAMERKLFDRGYFTHVLAGRGDGVLLLQLAQSALAAGLITICSAGTLYEIERERARELVPLDRFLDLDVSDANLSDEQSDELCQNLSDRGILPKSGSEPRQDF